MEQRLINAQRARARPSARMEGEIFRLQGLTRFSLEMSRVRWLMLCMTDWQEKGQSGSSRIEECQPNSQDSRTPVTVEPSQ